MALPTTFPLACFPAATLASSLSLQYPTFALLQRLYTACFVPGILSLRFLHSSLHLLGVSVQMSSVLEDFLDSCLK